MSNEFVKKAALKKISESLFDKVTDYFDKNPSSNDNSRKILRTLSPNQIMNYVDREYDTPNMNYDFQQKTAESIINKIKNGEDLIEG